MKNTGEFKKIKLDNIPHHKMVLTDEWGLDHDPNIDDESPLKVWKVVRTDGDVVATCAKKEDALRIIQTQYEPHKLYRMIAELRASRSGPFNMGGNS